MHAPRSTNRRKTPPSNLGECVEAGFPAPLPLVSDAGATERHSRAALKGNPATEISGLNTAGVRPQHHVQATNALQIAAAALPTPQLHGTGTIQFECEI